jgi:hypothetical protein
VELRRSLERAVGEARRDGKRLVRQLEMIASQLVATGGTPGPADGPPRGWQPGER